uniref:Uncharacterized protein n=1 Tax=viral metagenome TaxID=1070528 RepID=A0A6M3JHP0_9ZZZZ
MNDKILTQLSIALIIIAGIICFFKGITNDMPILNINFVMGIVCILLASHISNHDEIRELRKMIENG